MRCKYIRKIFQNEENGYTVALFSTLDHEVPLSARDKSVSYTHLDVYKRQDRERSWKVSCD